jgi:hypothetical protein
VGVFFVQDPEKIVAISGNSKPSQARTFIVLLFLCNCCRGLRNLQNVGGVFTHNTQVSALPGFFQ